MTGVLAIGHIFRLGVGMLMLAGMTACDDTPETPTPKSSEIRKELMRERLSQKARKSMPSLTVQNFEMSENGQTVTLRAADKDRIIALGTGLCDFDSPAGEANKGKIQQALKAKTNKLISALLEMGHTTGSIMITKVQDGGNFKQKIHFSWKGSDQQTSCQAGTF
jgi:hypothetical protein